MLVRLDGLVMCSVSMIGVHGEVGECVLMGEMGMLKGECMGWIRFGMWGFVEVGWVAGLGSAVLCCFLNRCRQSRRSCLSWCRCL